jgi:uncharacterized protein (TIGR02271 family)
MQHTLVAVFDEPGAAQSAKNELLAAGFAAKEVRLSEAGAGAESGAMVPSDSSGTHDQSIVSSVKHFFTDLFGADSTYAETYSAAVGRGHCILTVSAFDEPEVERAADIVERFGPIDIDERAAQWAGGAPLAGAEAMRISGAGGLQQSQGMSLQSHGDRNLFQQQSLNDDVPMGATYQEPTDSGADLQVPRSASRQGAATEEGAMQASTQQGSMQRDTSADSSTAIPVVQEQMKIGKREVQRGGMRVVSHIVETPVSEAVDLREEHVKVERHAVDQPVSASDTTAFREQSIEMRETAEEAVVEKSARVVEEVVVSKEVREHQELVTGTVRHTEIEVEQLRSAALADDDSYYRSHWNSTYGSSGGSYDDYAPAYSHGRDMASMYRGRPWEDVEADVRSAWEKRDTSGGPSTWEKFKAAIRHGWDRMTS